MILKAISLILIYLNFQIIQVYSQENELPDEASPMIAQGEENLQEISPNEAIETVENKPLTEDEIIALLTEKHKGTVVGNYMESNPRLTKLTVRVTLDKNIKKLWGDTLNDKTRYYIFAVFFILTMVINWAWKRRDAGSLLPLKDRVFGFIKRFLAINVSRVLAFLYLFKTELAPVWVVFKKTFDI